jgi:Ca2+-binding EF-hand superfamily protein
MQLQLMTLEMETGYSKSSIRRLENRFKSLDKGDKGYLEKRDLMSISEVFTYFLFKQERLNLLGFGR